MLFGSRNTMALEAIVEPSGDFAPTLGANVVGRLRLFICGKEFGDFDEPSCVLRSVAEHLIEFGDTKKLLWHQAFVGKNAAQRFQLLDDALFRAAKLALPAKISDTVFLTNVSEAFDPLKSFLLSPPGGNIQVLLRGTASATVQDFEISPEDFFLVANKFMNWLKEQESKLGYPHA